MKRTNGFTLIELLIVVAIIAILAAIAIPNFLAAQTRSKVSRTKADMRSYATGIESYYVDNNSYPLVTGNMRISESITTPIAYVTSIGKDPFGNSSPMDLYNFPGSGWKTTEDYWYGTKDWYDFYGYGWYIYPAGHRTGPAAKWDLQSKGPDHCWSQAEYPGVLEVDEPYDWVYDPSNGTVSRGNIVRSGP
jgi:prepilin-type N-terminal cleavage/methylation domain-containing protein